MSQNLKPIDILKSLPDYWNEEDKTNYEMLVADAKRYFPYMNEYVIHIGVMAHINKELGRGKELNEEEAKELMEKYQDKNIEYVTPYDPDFDFKATMKEVVAEQKISNTILEDEQINETDGECISVS